jgi:hypothetical protein
MGLKIMELFTPDFGKKITFFTITIFCGKGTLNITLAERSANHPAGSTRIFSAMDAI